MQQVRLLLKPPLDCLSLAGRTILVRLPTPFLVQRIMTTTGDSLPAHEQEAFSKEIMAHLVSLVMCARTRFYPRIREIIY